MAHKRRRFAGFGSLPLVGSVKDVLARSVKFDDVLVGALLGVGATGVGKWAYNKAVMAAATAAATNPSPATQGLGDFLTSDYVKAVVPALSGAAVGVAAYYAMGKSSKAVGYAAGSTAAGVAVSAFDVLKTKVDGLADIVAYKYNGLIANDRVYNGLIANDRAPALAGYADQAGLQGLAAVSMGDDDEDVVDELLS